MTSKYKRYKKSYDKYQQINKEKIKKYRQKNRSYFIKHSRDWRDIHNFGGNRERVLERDNWQCRKCGMTNEQHILIFGRSITVDHIDGKGRYSKEKNNNLDNLMTLCLRCHGTKDNYLLRWRQKK